MTSSYLALLGRVPDPAGLEAALAGLRDGSLRRGLLLRQLGESTERRELLAATARLGGLLSGQAGAGDAAFVTAAHQLLVGRPPFPERLASAVADLEAGRATRAHVVSAIAASAECRALPVVEGAYRELLRRSPTPDERWRGVQLVSAAGMDPTPLEREIRGGVEHYLEHAPEPSGERDAPPPRDVWLELTTRCNLVPACVMCGYAFDPHARPRQDMDPAIWRALVPRLRAAATIGLHGGGEPLLYPHLFELLAALDPDRTDIGFNSNGHLLDRERSRRLVEAGLGWVSVSLDAATPHTYLRVRRRKDFDALLAKVRGLVAERRAAGRSRPAVEINMTLMRLNLPEAPRFVELAAELGLTRVMFQQLQPGGRQVLVAHDGSTFDYDGEVVARCPELHDEMVGRARERARALGVELRYEIAYRGDEAAGPAAAAPDGASLPPAVPSGPGLRCPEPWSRLVVSVTGDAFFCCAHLSNGISLGRLDGVSFDALWNGRRARLLRRLVAGQPSPACCRGCFRVPGPPTELPRLPA